MGVVEPGTGDCVCDVNGDDSSCERLPTAGGCGALKRSSCLMLVSKSPQAACCCCCASSNWVGSFTATHNSLVHLDEYATGLCADQLTHLEHHIADTACLTLGLLPGVFTLLPVSLPVGVGGCDELGVLRSSPLLSDTPDAIVSPADPAAAAGFADAAAAALAAFC